MLYYNSAHMFAYYNLQIVHDTGTLNLISLLLLR